WDKDWVPFIMELLSDVNYRRRPEMFRAIAHIWKEEFSRSRQISVGSRRPRRSWSRMPSRFSASSGQERVLKMRNHEQPFLPRIEDTPLLKGEGRFADDARTAGAAFAAFVRSPHAAANIRSVDVGAAPGQPGVLAVLTGADTRAV